MSFSTSGLEQCDRDIAAVSELVPRVDATRLRDIQFLNKGKFGHVRLVALVGGPPSLSLSPRQRDSGNGNGNRTEVYASKSVNLNATDPEDAARQLANEALILSGLSHENIIELRGLCSEIFSESFSNGSRGYFLLFDVLDETVQNRLEIWRKKKSKTPRLLENCRFFQGSNLRRQSKKKADSNNEHQRMYKRIKGTMIGIARGLEYLHSRNIVLRDLKPANIGYRKCNNIDGSKRTVLKLIDFGLAQKVGDRESEENFSGSLTYMAPEVMNGEGHTLEADVFSFGVVLSEICTLRLPYEKSRKNPKNLSKDDFRDQFIGSIVGGEMRPIHNLEGALPCPRIRALIQECWDIPAKRPPCKNIVARLDTIFHCPPRQ